MSLTLLPPMLNPPESQDDFSNSANILDSIGIGKGVGIGTSITISERTSLLKPVIEAGSVVEVGRVIFYANTDEELVEDSYLVDGIVHIKILPSASGKTATAILTSEDIPEWNTKKCGRYNLNGELFLDIVMTKAGSYYTKKGVYKNSSSNIIYYFSGGIKINGDISVLNKLKMDGYLSGGNDDSYRLKWKILRGQFAAYGSSYTEVTHGIDTDKLVACLVTHQQIQIDYPPPPYRTEPISSIIINDIVQFDDMQPGAYEDTYVIFLFYIE